VIEVRGEKSMRKISILILVSLLVIFSTSLIFAQQSGRNQPQTSSAQQKISSESLIEGTQVVVRIVAVRDNVPPASEYTVPGKGNKFVSIQIVVDNSKGDTEWEVKPDNFRIKDAEGSVYDAESSVLSSSEVTQPH
jgi:hypothetical protein